MRVRTKPDHHKKEEDMKKRIGSLFLVLALCLSLMPMTVLAEDATAWDGSIATTFAGGTGTESDPYQIADGAQLAYLASEVNKGQAYENSYFVLTADVNLGNIEWTPIGNSFSDALFGGTDYSLFAGNLDGKGHTISNISIGTENNPFESDVFGLFGATDGKISNLNLDGVTICGIAKNVNVFSYVYVIGLAGALAGSASGPIENCHVVNLNMTMNTPDNGMVAAYWIGGLVGALDGGQHIKECSASGTIKELSGKGSIGGLIGELGRAAKITYSHADAALDVKPNYYGGARVGGLIGKGNGENDPETVISNCYAMGSVTGGAYSGGFAGSLYGLNIKNCYATGDVTGAAGSMGTFAGTDGSNIKEYGSVTNCYTTGTLSGKAAYMYAFTMQQEGTPRSPTENCYFADTNSALINLNETTVFKALAEMQTEGFKDTLNANDPANGWLFREGKTPLCGAEPADYSAVDAALAKIPADLTAYTDESVTVLNNAKANVVRGKALANQSAVDAMAKAIEDAIKALVKKPTSSDYYEPTYPITTPDKTENGAVTVSPKNAAVGSTVTVTVTPNSGYTLETLTVTDKNGKELKLTDKGDGKYTFTMPSGKVDIKATFMEDNSLLNFFYDVPNDSYYFDAVKWAVKNGITAGVGDNLFVPNRPCTRAEIVTFLWRAAGSPVVNYAMNMSDIPEGAYYAEAVRWALSEGIAVGTSADTFSPEDTCTRAEAVTFLCRAKGSKMDYNNEFTDVGGDDYYADAVAWAEKTNVTVGVGNDKFAPDDDCSRGQIVTFLYRTYQN